MIRDQARTQRAYISAAFWLALWMGAASVVVAQDLDEQRVRAEEQARRHGALRVGSNVILGPPDRDNWTPAMNRYVGASTRVLELVPETDLRGCYGVRVAADGGIHFWRVRNLSGQGLRSGEYLECERIAGTQIPLCVVPLRNDIALLAEPSEEAQVLGTIPLFAVEAEGGSRRLPRHLYVHRTRGEYYEVMESDFGSRETLGWVRNEDTVVWPTRQGYVIDRARNPRVPLVGYGSLEDWGNPARAAFHENMASRETPDPNETGLCEGLLIERAAVRGIAAVRCAMIPSPGEPRELVWLPYEPDRGALQPYVLMTIHDLIELSGNFATLVGACELGYADEIKQAMEEDWDLQAKLMTGTRERAQRYARFYREVQRIYPALSHRLALPPGETSEQDFRKIGDRAARSVRYVTRIIEEMEADNRTWTWVRVSDL